jgi:hypothetical protein
MCKAAGRPWSRYWDAKPSRDFAEALATEVGIPISVLIQSVKGGGRTAFAGKPVVNPFADFDRELRRADRRLDQARAASAHPN